MRAICIATGVLLAVGSAFMLFMTFAFATLSAGGLEKGSQEWWLTVLSEIFETPATFIFIAGLISGVGFWFYRPGVKMTAGGMMTMIGLFAILLGLFLRAAVQERQWMESRTFNPDGSKHVVKEYRNWFGHGRTVEIDEP